MPRISKDDIFNTGCEVEVFSPAKINLTLSIGGPEKNRMHRLRSLIQPLDFGDTLRVSIEPSEGESSLDLDFQISKALEEHLKEIGSFEIFQGNLNSESNLALQAARSFLEATEVLSESPEAVRVKLFIDKKIPPQAGLGGGSSNAAATLMALNKLLKKPLSDLDKLASQLGSDTTAFLRGGAVFIYSFGEKCIEAPIGQLPQPWSLLIKPPWGQATSEAYSNLDLSRPVAPAWSEFLDGISVDRELQGFGLSLSKDGNRLIMLPAESSSATWLDSCANDFQLHESEADQRFTSKLTNLVDGDNLKVLLSGSGSTRVVLGLQSEAAALKLEGLCRRALPAGTWTQVCKLMS